MADRTFGGFRYDQRLQVSFFGEVFRGRSKQGGAEIRVTRIADGLAKIEAFADALVHFGRAFAMLKHDNVVTTRAVGRDPNDDLLVVTDRVPKPVTLEEILIEFEGKAFPRAVTVALASSIIDALAYVHGTGLCHGALHPRSIWIDVNGRVYLADCAAGRALAAAGASNARLLDGIRDYVAPEVKNGRAVSSGADVYSAGALIGELLGESKDLEPVIRRASADDPHDRFADGAAMKRAFDLAVSTGGELERADSETLGILGRAAGSSEPDALDSATEDLLSTLEPAESEFEPKPKSSAPVPGLDDALGGLDEDDDALDDALGGLDDGDDGLDDDDDGLDDALGGLDDGDDGLDDALGDLDDGDDAADEGRPKRGAGESSSARPAPTSSAPKPEASKGPGRSAGPEGPPRPAVPTAGSSSGRRFPRAKPRAQAGPGEAQNSPAIERARQAAKGRDKLHSASVEPETGEVTAVDENVDSLLAATDPISELIKLGPAGATSPSAEQRAVSASTEELEAELGIEGRARLGDDQDELDGPSTEAGHSRAVRNKAKPSRKEAEQGAASAIDALADELGDDDLDAHLGADESSDDVEPIDDGPGSADEPLATSKPAPAGAGTGGIEPGRAVPALSEPQAVLALGDDGLDPGAQLKKGRGLWWMAAAVIAVGSAFGYIYTQTDVFHPERARLKAQEAERKRLEKEAELKAAQDKPGTIVVESEEPDAAVWLLLGRTPLDTFKLPASATNDLRFEFDGYKPLDLPVTGPMWTGGGEGEELRAAIHARLEAGKADAPLPAFPPEPETTPPPGPEGQGVVHVESTPPGAEVWLLVGFTPEVRISGLVAGRTYELKLLKDGFIPGLAVFKDDSWYLSGEAGVGSVKPELERTVKLEPDPDAAKKHRKKRKGK